MNRLLQRLRSSLPMTRTTRLQTSSPLVADATCTSRSGDCGLAEVQLKVRFTHLVGKPNP
jgi:hypothetical protein